jgi:hypothetical protein
MTKGGKMTTKGGKMTAKGGKMTAKRGTTAKGGKKTAKGLSIMEVKAMMRRIIEAEHNKKVVPAKVYDFMAADPGVTPQNRPHIYPTSTMNSGNFGNNICWGTAGTGGAAAARWG